MHGFSSQISHGGHVGHKSGEHAGAHHGLQNEKQIRVKTARPRLPRLIVHSLYNKDARVQETFRAVGDTVRFVRRQLATGLPHALVPTGVSQLRNDLLDSRSLVFFSNERLHPLCGTRIDVRHGRVSLPKNNGEWYTDSEFRMTRTTAPVPVTGSGAMYVGTRSKEQDRRGSELRSAERLGALLIAAFTTKRVNKPFSPDAAVGRNAEKVASCVFWQTLTNASQSSNFEVRTISGVFSQNPEDAQKVTSKN
jgi:hypothetical protein